jgi:polysaccharide pyruvyl transferase WcaK-like protein
MGVDASRCGSCGDPARWLQLPPRRLAGPHLGVSVMQYFRYYADEPSRDHRLEHRICELLKQWFDRHDDSRVSLVGFYSADGQRDDIAIARRIAARMDDKRVTVVDPAGRLDACLEAFRSFSHFVSMRYHSQVLASMFGIPQVTIAYHQKNRMFAEEVGMPANRYVRIRDFVRGEGQTALRALFDEPVGSEAPRGDLHADEHRRRLFPREAAA